MRTEITSRQRQVLATIAAETERRGVAPTFRELAQALGITSTFGITCHLRALRKRGLLEYQEGKARTIKLTAKGPKKTCACAEALALLEAGSVEQARQLLSTVVKGR